jgi:hypothetical protein
LDVVGAWTGHPVAGIGVKSSGADGSEEDFVSGLDGVPAFVLHALVFFAAAVGADDVDGEVVD